MPSHKGDGREVIEISAVSENHINAMDLTKDYGGNKSYYWRNLNFSSPCVNRL